MGCHESSLWDSYQPIESEFAIKSDVPTFGRSSSLLAVYRVNNNSRKTSLEGYPPQSAHSKIVLSQFLATSRTCPDIGAALLSKSFRGHDTRL